MNYLKVANRNRLHKKVDCAVLYVNLYDMAAENPWVILM